MTDNPSTREQCPHTDLTWRKSSACTGNATCVEVAELPGGGFAVRDGKNPDEPGLAFGAAAWTGFLAGVRAGEFDPGRR